MRTHQTSIALLAIAGGLFFAGAHLAGKSDTLPDPSFAAFYYQGAAIMCGILSLATATAAAAIFAAKFTAKQP